MQHKSDIRVSTAEPGQKPRPGCEDCAIRHRAVCAKCDEDELRALDRVKTYRDYEAGDVVVWAGDEMHFLGSVVSGIAALRQSMEDGRTQIVGLLLPSDFVGRPGRAVAPYDVVATTPLRLCCFRRHSFEQLLETTPTLSERLLEMTLDELDAAREWMVVLGRKSAREKLASLLAIIVRRNIRLTPAEPSRGAVLDLSLTRGSMADFLGLTLETVSRQFSALKRDGVIQLDGARRIVIPDIARLIEEAGDDNGGLIS